MRALAEFGCDLGWNVSGSDAAANKRTVDKLTARGVAFHHGHSASHLSPDVRAVVHSPAIPPLNVEREAALDRSIPDVSYPEMLGEISRRYPTIAVTGTHGKSTTTGLIGTGLTEAGLAGAVLCGAEVLSSQRHGWSGPGRWAVVEACEYRRHFVELSPEIAVVLSVEPDHFDCFPEIDDAIDAYCEFLELIAPGGLVLINIDTAAARTVLGETDALCRVETMSTRGDEADWTADDVRQNNSRLQLKISFQGRFEDELAVPLLGDHHAGNVLAAYAAMRAAGAGSDVILRSLAQFSGLARRLEPFPSWRGVTRFDDYAHHPTAVSAVLRTVRQDMRLRTKKRLVCAFQPHQISRTERFVAEFGEALSLADQAWVLPVYAAREAGGDRAEALSREIIGHVSSPCEARFLPSLDHALVTLETALRPGDVFVTLGAGDIDCLQYELPRRFP
jgi:UDP-N-acetylmuramate--alanine ligase